MHRRDHPRLRGNYEEKECYEDWTEGSPPLTRELHKDGKRVYTTDGITPAYAGTTTCFRLLLFGFRDHPRLRGNYAKSSATKGRRLGSPPLTRELLANYLLYTVLIGITPAYAGTTL